MGLPRLNGSSKSRVGSEDLEALDEIIGEEKVLRWCSEHDLTLRSTKAIRDIHRENVREDYEAGVPARQIHEEIYKKDIVPYLE